MSFAKIIDSIVVDFKEENDYLNCRLSYLQYCKDAVMPEVTFSQYIIGEMYPSGSCEVEVVTDIPESNSVGNDSNMHFNNTTSSTTIDTSTMDMNSTYTYNPDTNAINIVENSWVVSPATPSAVSPEEIADAIWNTVPISYSVGVDIAYNDDGNISDIKVKAEENKKEEPPDDPIENRWQILDL